MSIKSTSAKSQNPSNRVKIGNSQNRSNRQLARQIASLFPGIPPRPRRRQPRPRRGPRRYRRALVRRTTALRDDTEFHPTFRILSGDMNSVHVSGCEIVTTSQAENFFYFLPICPLLWKGTMVQRQAISYSDWRPIVLRLHYIPSVAKTAPGNVVAGTLWSSTMTFADRESVLTRSNGGCMQSIASPFTTTVSLSTNLPQNLFSSDGVKMNSIPFVFLAYTKDTLSAASPGTFAVEYEFVFKNTAAPRQGEFYRTTFGDIANTSGQQVAYLLDEKNGYGIGTLIKYGSNGAYVGDDLVTFPATTPVCFVNFQSSSVLAPVTLSTLNPVNWSSPLLNMFLGCGTNRSSSNYRLIFPGGTYQGSRYPMYRLVLVFDKASNQLGFIMSNVFWPQMSGAPNPAGYPQTEITISPGQSYIAFKAFYADDTFEGSITPWLSFSTSRRSNNDPTTKYFYIPVAGITPGNLSDGILMSNSYVAPYNSTTDLSTTVYSTYNSSWSLTGMFARYWIQIANPVIFPSFVSMTDDITFTQSDVFKLNSLSQSRLRGMYQDAPENSDPNDDETDPGDDKEGVVSATLASSSSSSSDPDEWEGEYDLGNTNTISSDRLALTGYRTSPYF